MFFLVKNSRGVFKVMGFLLVKCSPYHNQTIGLAEAMVKVAKRILKKAKDDNSDPRI
jgi:hypothetical protein